MKMSKMIFAVVSIAMAAGCATVRQPDSNPAKFDSYDSATKSVEGDPNATDWQAAEAERLKKETCPKALVASVADDCSMAALLASVKGAYGTDPMVATRIAAITQLSMCPKCGKAPELRYRWTKALLKALCETEDQGAQFVYLDQLRWCAFGPQSKCIAGFSTKAKNGKVAEFAALVAKEVAAAAGYGCCKPCKCGADCKCGKDCKCGADCKCGKSDACGKSSKCEKK